MKLHHFFDNFDLQLGQLTINNTEIVHQIKDVLKLNKNDKIILGNGQGVKAEADIIKYDKNIIEVFVTKITDGEGEPTNKVVLYCASLKRENLEIAVQKAVEVGAIKIVPLLTDRTIKTKVNGDRLEKIIKESAELAERSVLPESSEMIDLDRALSESLRQNELSIFFDPSGASVNDLPRLKKFANVGVFIGPEGGWSEREIALARERGLNVISMGRTILRGETAAIIGVYLAAYMN